MAFSPVAAVGPRDSLGAFICPICLEVFTAPWDTGCGHTFCEACLHRCLSTQQPQCAVCRSPLAARDARRNEAVERTMAEMLAPCSACSEKVRVSDFRAHTSTCAQAQKAQIAFQTPTTTAARYGRRCRSPQSLGPNRFTFMCPYCGTRNLDQDDLLRHCIERHHSDRTRVCAHQCHGATPTTAAQTSSSTSRTGTASPTTPTWITRRTTIPPYRKCCSAPSRKKLSEWTMSRELRDLDAAGRRRMLDGVRVAFGMEDRRRLVRGNSQQGGGRARGAVTTLRTGTSTPPSVRPSVHSVADEVCFTMGWRKKKRQQAEKNHDCNGFKCSKKYSFVGVKIYIYIFFCSEQNNWRQFLLERYNVPQSTPHLSPKPLFPLPPSPNCGRQSR
ncbi:uncharacterized protein LOC144946779 isoform X3 [Lampetra fluviatilis]